MNEEEKKEESLFKKLIARFHKLKISQKIVGLTITTALVAGIAFAGYKLISNSNTTDPNNNWGDENTGNTNTGNSNNGSNGNNGDEDENSNYSELLQYLINDEYYSYIVESCTDRDNKTITYASGYLAALPYAFLEEEGYDIDAIKNSQLSQKVQSYILDSEPNNLYIACMIETKATTPYYTQYILKYHLTDQEIEDYNMLHSEKYLQAALINQAISDLKTPTVVNKARITVEAYENLLDDIDNYAVCDQLLNDQALMDFTLISVDVEAGKFIVQLRSNVKKDCMITSSKTIAYATLSNGTNLVAVNCDGAFYKPFKQNEFMFYSKDNQTVGESATVYRPSGSEVRYKRSSLELE